MARTDTRQRIVDAARELFWEQGFAATSLSQIAERSGALTGSIYYFFKTKDDILAAVVEHYAAELHHWLIDPVFAGTTEPRARVFGVIGTYRAFLLETRFALGCPVGGLATELGPEHAAARARLGDIFSELHHVLASCVRAMALGPGAPDADTLASLALTVIEGGIVQARAAHAIDPFDASVRALEDYFDRLEAGTPEPAAPPAG